MEKGDYTVQVDDTGEIVSSAAPAESSLGELLGPWAPGERDAFGAELEAIESAERAAAEITLEPEKISSTGIQTELVRRLRDDEAAQIRNYEKNRRQIRTRYSRAGWRNEPRRVRQSI